MPNVSRCPSCSQIKTCPVCGAKVQGFLHVGVRATKGGVSKIMHWAQPCGHAVEDTHLKSRVTSGKVQASYGGGPLWKAGYIWVNIFWGSYWSGAPELSIPSITKAVKDISSDPSYFGGLSEYNVGMGVMGNSFVISSDPPSTIDNSQIQTELQSWISSGTVTDVKGKGAYNIFLPPGISVTLQGSGSCSTFCDFHDAVSPNGPFYTVEPFPCPSGCNQCTSSDYDTLTQGLSEEMCILPGEILLGDNKAISEYEIGDSITGTQGLDTVTAKFNRQYEGKMLRLKAHGLLPLTCTPNHPILTVQGTMPSNHSKPIAYSTPEWKRADELKEKHTRTNGNYLLLPILQGTLKTSEISLEKFFNASNNQLLKTLRQFGTPTEFPLNADTAWFLGIFVAEGSANINDVTLALHENEANSVGAKIKQILGSLGYRVTVNQVKGTHGIRVYIGSRHLSNFLEEYCGKGALSKKIPDFILYHEDISLLRAFLDGYVAGDGCHYTGRKGYKQTLVETVSEVLAMQLQLAFARIGQFLTLRKGKTGKKMYVHGRLCQTHNSYIGQLSETSKAKKIDGFFAMPIVSVEGLEYKGSVMNVETLSHTYLVSNAIVHNCELATDMNPGTGWTIGNIELCDFCDKNFTCHQIATGEYVNSWLSNSQGRCWGISNKGIF
jgi:hypothetical protein